VKEPLKSLDDTVEDSPADRAYFELLGRSLIAYIEEHKQILPTMTLEQAKEKGFRQLNEFCWKQKGGTKSCAWVRHQDGKLYRLVPEDQK
jgi:hypothetical protein